MKIKVRIITTYSAFKGERGYISGGQRSNGSFNIQLDSGLNVSFFGSEFEFFEVVE